jgi:hypothetical protein
MGGHTASNLVGRAHSSPLHLGMLLDPGDCVLYEVVVMEGFVVGFHGL